ncbi:MAG TPA: beta-ketoacyl synthase N-terminal-like domain-containing protein, partial [Phycisphaerales bacterium]|nr:beta-ketoacyl synthase N-terminal-like domain-containing protein [Phycisphaerales bacterium]
MARRVVITGIGTVSALGVGTAALWEALRAGATGVGVPTRLSLAGFPCQLGAEIKGEFSAKDFVPKAYRKAVKVMARDTEIAVAAAKEAFDDAKIFTRAAEGQPTTFPPPRLGCQIGAGLIAAETHELTSALATSVNERGEFDYARWGTIAQHEGQTVGGMNNLQPLWMLKYLPNMLACHVTIIHGNEGPSNTITCGEASGLLSIGEAARVIERDAADVSIAGSAESKLSLMGTLRMTLANRYGNLPSNADPATAVRPYDTTSPGGVPGEGGGLLILEEHSSASKRGVPIYAQVAGFGAAHNARRDVPPGERNMGLVFAVNAALRDAGCSADDIDVIVPQAAGAPSTDEQEYLALKSIFGERLGSVPCIALAPTLGDCAAGNGGLQAAVAALIIKHQTLPARLGAANLPLWPAAAR